MAREIGKLTALAASRAKTRGYISDGGGLYLQISANGAKSWVFRFRDGPVPEGKQQAPLREMGLGPVHTISLAEAREHARKCRKLRLEGKDPIAERKAEVARAALEAARAITFKDAAEKYIEQHKVGWKNAKHAAQWPATLEAYVYPILGPLPVQDIDRPLVLKVLEPIWNSKRETASRVRGRIAEVLEWAKERGYRDGENPARWRGKGTLPQRTKTQTIKHHSALPYVEIGAFMAKLREQGGSSPMALELVILTAARTSEVIGATWGEVDLKAGVWTVPAERIKTGKEHRVPLSKPALALLERLHEAKQDVQPGQFIFAGGKINQPLSNMAMLKLLRRMDRSDLTVHGFRSTFRDWAAERTNFPRDVAEQALAHSLPDKVEAAYRRGDLFEKRRKLMEAWAGYCAQPSHVGTVTPIHAAKA